MIIGILKEIKVKENRVCMTPAGVIAVIANGHSVLVEKNAGVGSGFSDEEYIAAGATMIETPAEIFKKADMVMHVKEPQPSEYGMLRKGQILFTYLHLAADEPQTKALMESGATCIAYETIQKADKSLPLLTPMSEVAGRMAIQQGAKALEKTNGGLGKLLGGVPGVEPAKVMVIGGGVVGVQAAKMACGLGAQVYLMDINLDRLRYLDDVMPANCTTLMSSKGAIQRLLPEMDLVVGAVLIPGAKAPAVITRDDLKLMKKGSALVDVAIDQGGCFETSKPTTHTEPTYEVDGVVHYCVANIPGAVPMTSTMALTNATLPYTIEIANKGWKQACIDNKEIKLGLNVHEGKLTYRAVCDAFDLPYTPASEVL
ncbi:alanine dehydrogenase [Halodesulfovibrio spirochaetisodalis]|uniref:Alanine dehydrogenase n=1 Tax=Halodesulfovibrio spirochaetisodalis TaxID=1560234 RepID=A0A1B7XMQ2_9BACT|nr:alanine dehydrogenase [Halodesulfovibrio spirochaetisodalis]OBQ56794.1 alanine dehydrogenase [Halodesulfovibrio spirochaetisodalis]